MIKKVILVALGCFCNGTLHSEIYSVVNLSEKDVIVEIKDPGGYDVQKLEPGNCCWKYEEYIAFNGVVSNTNRLKISPKKTIFLDFCFNYAAQKFPLLEFHIASTEVITEVINLRLSHKPELQKEGDYIVSQNFGVEQEQLVGQRISDSKQLGRAYMAIVLESAKEDGSQGIEKEKASSQKSSNAHEEDVNNDSAEKKTVNKKAKKTMTKNTTDKQPAKLCCQIY